MFDLTYSSAKAYLIAAAAVGLVTACLAPFQPVVSPTTVALALLLVVLFVAAGAGMGPAVAASLAGMVCFNFFFLPPLHTMTIANPENWVALAAFLVTAITAGQLSAHARRRAEEAESGRREVGRLYDELREAFDRASRAEALRQSEQLKSALLDAVTHDLRTPLTSIKMSVTTLLGEVPEDRAGAPTALAENERRELLEVIDEETDRLDRSIGNLVEVARLEAGHVNLRRRWTSPREVVAEAVSRARRGSRARALEVAVDDDTPSIVADGRALAEVVYILVDNALKYTPPGTRVRVAATEADTGVRFTVEDEGPGIPPELRERIFEKFFRAAPDAETSFERPPGTGLGLAIARGIVEAHGGRVWADAGAGGGAAFRVWLPIGDDDAPTAAREVAPKETV
jgi:two-component system sensor histidine kinase KdpD